MPAALRILIVEDNADDAELVLRQLRRAGMDVRSQRVDDVIGVNAALDASNWDVVLADYNLPTFSGVETLRILSDRGIDVPLILVSGEIDVPTALAAMKAGARDFVLKDDLARLASVVEREVAEADARREGRRAENERDTALAELQEANEQLIAFARLADVPLQAMTPERVTESLLSRVVAAIGADGAAILLLGDDGQLVTGGAVGSAAGTPGAVRLGTGFAGAIAAENRPMYVADAAVDERVRPDLRASGVHSMLGVPMHYAGRVVGVLHADWCRVFEPPAWEVPLLEIAADRCAIAVENARIYDHEHSIAETLQRALLSASTTIPDLDIGHFYGSATMGTLVGGDFYDVFETEPGLVAFSIGDVSGKGLGAASITSLAKNTLRALAIDDHPPGVVMEKSNEVVARFTNSETFITAVYGLLDTRTRQLRYCSAGHPPIAVVGPAGVRMLTERGPLLGALQDVDYPCATEQLGTGDSVVLYTDGLTEARSPENVFYGDERLMAFLSTLTEAAPQDIATRLFEEIWNFSGGKLRDDVAVLVLRPRLS
jgi:FixJ family two-component response regulator